MSGAFDPEAFMGQQTKSASATKMEPIPEGEYIAVITEKVTCRQGDREDGTTFIVMDVEWEISGKADGSPVDELLKRLNRQKLSVRQSLFLDIENGIIAEGNNKNVRLGRLRAAVGQNASGKAWAPMMLKNAGPAIIIVGTRPDKQEPDIIYNEVKRVAPASRGTSVAA